MNGKEMRPERWRQVDEILGAALEREGSQRSAFLDEACAGDAALRYEVESLLAAAQGTSDLEKPPADLAASLVSANGFHLEAGRNIGRYVVLSTLGEGGMGVVYAAYDPELDRRVAVKVLHERVGDAAELRARLLREAQAMAKLSHPNVVSVHDVGRFEEKVFVAMEFIDGRTLGEWVKEKPRSWREVLGVFLQAGKGLAAAHSAGLVHRDFKPGNVLVGKNGSVKVTDFGLAFTQGDRAASGIAMAGTPAYMAPEQLRGETPDARADQYSFCVALYEALAREKLTEGTMFAALASRLEEASVFSETVRSPPRRRNSQIVQVRPGSGVPRWVLRPVLRGLSVDRSKRFETLDELLRTLEEPRSPWKRIGAGVAIAAVVASCIVAYRVTMQRQSAICRGAEQSLAGIWDPAREEAIQRAFLATAKPFAADAFKGTKRVLDAASQGWVAMHTEACQATRLRGEQSEALLDLRMGCLRSRLDEMRALTNIFARADAQVVERAVEAAQALTPLRGCADAAALTAQVKPPQDPATYARVERHRGTLAEIKALKDTGKYERALEMAKPLLAASRETGYKPLEVETLLMLGSLLQRTNQNKEAEEVLRLSATGADAVRDDQRRARAWSQLAYVVGYQDSRMEEGLRLAQEANAVVERLENPPELEAQLDHVLGDILLRQGKNKEALQHMRQALEIRQKTLSPEDPDIARSFSVLGNALADAAQYEESLSYHQKAVQILEAAMGPEHPWVAAALGNMGNLLSHQSKFEPALKAHQRALAIYESGFGPKSPRVALSLMHVGADLRGLARYAEALSLYQRALAIQEETLGAEHADLVNTLNNLGNLYHDTGDLEASIGYQQRALAIAERVFGPEHPKVAMILNNLGRTLREEDKFQPAFEHLQRALAIREKALGPEHPDVATTLVNLALTVEHQNTRASFEIAIDYLRRALAIEEKALGAESPRTAEVLIELGGLQSQRSQPEGLAHLQRALEIREKSFPPESPLIGSALSRMGEAYLDLREPLEARPRLERALRLLEASKGDPSKVAWTRFQLARALWDTRSDRERAIVMAEQSRASLFEMGKAKRGMLRKVDAWLARRSKPPERASFEGVKRETL
jgi:eukaryotic-like serine/threonine-protein kinase